MNIDEFPKLYRKAIDGDLLAHINKIIVDENLQDTYRRIVLDNIELLEENYTTKDYLNAVAFHSFIMIGNTKRVAWAKVFPDKYQRLIDMGVPDKEISAHAYSYGKGKLCVAIEERLLVPIWIANYGNYQKAINVQVDLMQNAKSELVRCKAADSLLTHLAKPKELAGKIDINIGAKSETVLDLLQETIGGLVEQQKSLIRSGVATGKVINGSVIAKKEDKSDEKYS